MSSGGHQLKNQIIFVPIQQKFNKKIINVLSSLCMMPPMFAAKCLTVGRQSSCPSDLPPVIYPASTTWICKDLQHPLFSLSSMFSGMGAQEQPKVQNILCPLSQVLISAPNNHPIVPSHTPNLWRIQADWYSGMSGGFKPCYGGYACSIATA